MSFFGLNIQKTLYPLLQQILEFNNALFLFRAFSSHDST